MDLGNIKELVTTAEAKIKGDPDMLAKFKAEPVKTLEGILGVDLPDEQIKGVVDMLKVKLAGDGAGDAIHKLMDGVTGLFHKGS